MKDPESAAEWQEAIDAAAGLRAIADCKMYGLIEGGPNIDVARCDDILERGRAQGVRPSKSIDQLAIEVLASVNSETEPADRRSAAQQRRRARERALRAGK